MRSHPRSRRSAAAAAYNPPSSPPDQYRHIAAGSAPSSRIRRRRGRPYRGWFGSAPDRRSRLIIAAAALSLSLSLLLIVRFMSADRMPHNEIVYDIGRAVAKAKERGMRGIEGVGRRRRPRPSPGGGGAYFLHAPLPHYYIM